MSRKQTWTEQAPWRKCFEDLRSRLVAAQAERDLRRDADETGMPRWIAYERGVMHDNVNRLRAELDLPPVELGVIEAVENRAAGHIDYTKKFALYCADVVATEERA